MADVKPAGSSSANRIRVYNPTNPRAKRKPWTHEQAAARKDLAERFVRDVLEDDDRADEIAASTPEEYAAARGKAINPRRRNSMKKRVNPEQQKATPAVSLAQQQLDKLRRENDRLKRNAESFQDKLDEIADVASASTDGSEDEDELRTKLNTVLDLAAPGSAADDEEEDDGND